MAASNTIAFTAGYNKTFSDFSILIETFAFLLSSRTETFQEKEFCKQNEFVLITDWWQHVCQLGGGWGCGWGV